MTSKFISNKLIKAIASFDKKTNNPDKAFITERVKICVSQGRPLNLISFTCSTIQDKYMFSQFKPWLYVNLNPEGNNLEPDTPLIKKLVSQLNSIYPTQLVMIIGNTDPYYIYSQSFSTYPELDKKLLWEKYSTRWRLYKNNLNYWLRKQGLENINLISWYKFEKTLNKNTGINFEQTFNRLLPRITDYFPVSDLVWEKERLKTAFRPNRYFPTIPIPNNKTLNIWVKRKFTEYMLQGLFLYIFFPNTILIQNEKPSTLRTKMYQPLIQKQFNSCLPVIYPFGVDDDGYQ